MNFTRILAILKARNLEFFRDKGSLGIKAHWVGTCFFHF